MKKIWLLPIIFLFSASVHSADVKVLYDKSCTFCHAAGVNNAPKSFDAAAWEARIKEKGMDALVNNVMNGYKAMPPKGLCNECSKDDYKAIIEYISKAKQ